MKSSPLAFESLIPVRRVSDAARLQVLPQHFGRHMLAFESAVYVFAHQLSPEYEGGYWHFNELGNGGFYMAPSVGPLHLIVEGNGFEGMLSADAAGITLCLFACSHLSFRFPDAAFSQHYYWWRDFACEHPEHSLIAAAID